MSKLAIKYTSIILGIIVSTLLIKSLLLNGVPVVKLGSAPPLAGAVSQSLGLSGSSDDLPVAGKDYTIKNIHYFSGRQWAAATVAPTHNNADTVLVIMQKIEGTYQVVLGPSTTFANSYRYTLPAEVIEYLEQIGVLNG